MSFYKRLKEDILAVVPAIIFFCITFNLITFTTDLALQPEQIRHFNYVTVNISALIVGKIILLVNYLPFINAFPHKPLIYNIIWKFIIYSLFVFLFRLMHAYLHVAYHYKSFHKAYEMIHHEVLTGFFWAIQLWLFLLMLIFVIFAEFIRVLGKDKVKKMLLGSKGERL